MEQNATMDKPLSTGETLVTVQELCDIMNISKPTWLRIGDRLIARGLQEVEIEGCSPLRKRRFLRSSLDTVLITAAAKGQKL